MIEKALSLLEDGGVLPTLARVARSAFRRGVGRVFARTMARRSGAEGLVVRGVVTWERTADLEIGRDCSIGHGVHLSTEIPGARLVLRDGVQINDGVKIDYSGGLEIGQGTLLSSHCVIFTHTHGHDPRSAPAGIPLRIGADVWVGHGVIITERVASIGDGSLIAAGAVVTRDVSPGDVVGGNPAKVIGRRNR